MDYVFFFKQKTAYEMRISDWSSDVCSSDLGSDDKIVPETDSAKLSQRLALQKGIKIDYKKVQGADHFFEGKLDELTAAADKYIKVSLVPTSARAGKGAAAAQQQS